MIVGIVETLTAAAKVAKVSSSVLVAMCFYESSLSNVVRPQDGSSASYGVCQIKLSTARGIDKDLRATDLLNPEINAYVAATYLKKQIKRYGNVWCGVDAYNKGSVKSCPSIDNTYNSRYVNKVRHLMKMRPWIGHKKGHG